MNIVFIGLTLSSSWGNGHATTYRALLQALAERGHDVLFLECDRPWYAAHRDLTTPDYCRLEFYEGTADLVRFDDAFRAADLGVIGSYVVDGVAVAMTVRERCKLLAFYDIDTPVTLARLQSGEEDYISRAVIPHYDVYLSFTGGPTLQRLETIYGTRRAYPLYCSADPNLYDPSHRSAPPRWDLGYLGTYSPDRQPALEALLLEPARRAPGHRFVVAGPQYPDTIKWPDNVTRIEHLGPSEHAAFYQSQSWTLNITRSDMKQAGYSPSVRLFEAASCATPVISDEWPGLDDIFRVGEEICVANTGDDVLRTLSQSTDVARAIGSAARRRFLAAHTPMERAISLERIVAAEGGSDMRRCLQRAF